MIVLRKQRVIGRFRHLINHRNDQTAKKITHPVFHFILWRKGDIPNELLKNLISLIKEINNSFV